MKLLLITLGLFCSGQALAQTDTTETHEYQTLDFVDLRIEIPEDWDVETQLIEDNLNYLEMRIQNYDMSIFEGISIATLQNSNNIDYLFELVKEEFELHNTAFSDFSAKSAGEFLGKKTVEQTFQFYDTDRDLKTFGKTIGFYHKNKSYLFVCLGDNDFIEGAKLKYLLTSFSLIPEEMDNKKEIPFSATLDD